MPGLNFTVTKQQTASFAHAWDKGGVKIILDDTAIQFATDWANIVLRSFVADMAAQVEKVKQVKLAALKANQGTAGAATDAVATQIVPIPAASGPKVILTD